MYGPGNLGTSMIQLYHLKSFIASLAESSRKPWVPLTPEASVMLAHSLSRRLPLMSLTDISFSFYKPKDTARWHVV